MVVDIEIGDVEFTVVEYYQDRIIIIEFAQEAAVLIVVDAVYLNLDKIDLGSGKRVIAKGGVYDKKYQITIPAELKND